MTGILIVLLVQIMPIDDAVTFNLVNEKITLILSDGLQDLILAFLLAHGFANFHIRFELIF